MLIPIYNPSAGADPIFFGAKFDGVTNDTVAWQEAIDYAASKGVPVISGPGRSLVKVLPDPIYQYGNLTVDVYSALNINYSSLQFKCNGTTIYFKGDDIPTGQIGYVFSTDKNMDPEELSGISFDGLNIDFNPTGDPASINKRSIAVIGCNGFTVNNFFAYSSGARAGGTITVQNSSNVSSNHYTLLKVTQGWNFSYVDYIDFGDHSYTDFSEAIDFDRVARYINISNINFVNGNTGGVPRTGQCMDFNSCQYVNVKSVTFSMIGNLATCNYKDTTPQTYAEYVNNDPVLAYTIGKAITIDGVKGIGANAGAATSFLILGIDRTNETWVPCEDFTMINFDVNDVGIVSYEDVINITFENFIIRNGIGVNSNNLGQISNTTDPVYANSRCSAVLRNVKILGCTHQGITNSAVTTLILDGVEVKNCNTSGSATTATAIRYSNLAARNSVISIKDVNIDTVTGTSTGHAFNDGGVIAEYAIDWGIGNRIVGVTNPIILNGISYQMVKTSKTVPIAAGSVAITAAGNFDFPLHATGPNFGSLVANVVYRPTTAISADATNYVNYGLRSYIAGVDASIASTSDTAGVSAGGSLASGYSPPEAAAMLMDDDICYVRLTRQNSGRTLNGVAAQVSYMDFIIV